MPKKKFLVSLAKPDPKIKGMDVYGKIRKFSKQGHSFTLSDEGEAKELSKEFGQRGSGDIVVSEIPNYKPEAGHNYKFPPIRGMKPISAGKRREKLRKDGYIEVRPGVWKKSLHDK